MARTPTPRTESKGSPAPAPTSTPAAKGGRAAAAPREGFRETAEAIVVAFILALLVRGFEAEAFVIPTGSMAPTLMGRHKEIACPQCGYVYSVNASEEVESYVGSASSRRVHSGVCVNCRYQARIGDEPSFKGDRILVMKFPYDMPFLPGASGPRRWDVVVFRYPEEPEVSYIKRLVGLPGETLRIWYGDVFIKPPGGDAFRQARKPLAHQQSMQIMVYDDAHRAKALRDLPEWRRWTGAWAEDAAAPGTYTPPAAANGWSELRYQHLVPDPAQWRSLEVGEPVARDPKPTLVTDFYSYNTNLNAENTDLSGGTNRDQESAWLQPHWVGDLTVSARVAPAGQGPAGSVRFELIEGGVSNRCEVDLATGRAVLYHGDAEVGRAETVLKGTAAHDVTFANVDNRLNLIVDGRGAFGDGVEYEDDPAAHPEPTAEDLAPARVASRGGKVRLSGLVLKRDIYYTLTPGGIDYGNVWDPRMPRSPSALFALLADPEKVAALGPLGWADYPIGEDRFLMLGDNSPRSKDSRGWSQLDQSWDDSGREKWEVPRAMLTGKAFCIYWPHGKPFWPNYALGPDFRVPFRPYFERMKLIH